jgi:alpha-N-acetylglucosamine transferase
MCHTTDFYGKWAYNMAHSIKSLCDIPIHLVHDMKSTEGLDMAVFNTHSVAEFSKDFCYEKLRIFEHSPFEETLYLDVDGMLLNNPEEIFDKLKGSIVWTQPMGTGKKGDDTINYMWAKNDLLYERYNIPEDNLFTTTQTSIIYFTREAEGFFNQLKINYENRLKPIEYREMWGKSKQHPDELYYSVTMAQMGISLQEFRPVFFPEKVKTIEEIEQNYYVLSMYGGNNVKPYARAYYDRRMQNQVFNPKGLNHKYKVDRLYKNKFINIK